MSNEKGKSSYHIRKHKKKWKTAGGRLGVEIPQQSEKKLNRKRGAMRQHSDLRGGPKRGKIDNSPPVKEGAQYTLK